MRFCLFLIPLSVNLFAGDLDLPKPDKILEQKFKEYRDSQNLAPPPINFSREVIPLDGNRYAAVSYENNRLLIYADTKPRFPYIIKAPGGDHWVQIYKGADWISLQSVENKIKAFKSFWDKAQGGGEPPSTPVGGGNGGGDDDDQHKPFQVGDVVEVIAHPEMGYGHVSHVENVPSTHSSFWLVTAKFLWNEGITIYTAKPNKFKKVENFTVQESQPLGEKDDTAPTYPIIVKPKPNHYLIKIKPGHPWIPLEMIDDDPKFIEKLIRTVMGEPPKPPGGPGEHNGDSPLWYDPPFKRGDLVRYKGYPISAKLVVMDVWLRVLTESKKVVWFVKAVYKAPGQSQYKEVSDFAANFEKVILMLLVGFLAFTLFRSEGWIAFFPFLMVVGNGDPKPPLNNDPPEPLKPSGNGEHEGEKRKFIMGIFTFGFLGLVLGFNFYLFQSLSGLGAAFIILLMTLLTIVIAYVWQNENFSLLSKVIGAYFLFGILVGIVYDMERPGRLAVGSVIGTLSLLLLGTMSARLLTWETPRKFWSGYHEIPVPVKPPHKLELPLKIISSILWFCAVIGFYLRGFFDTSMFLFLGVSIPYFIGGIYLRLFEHYSKVSVHVTQLARLEERTREYAYMAWMKRLKWSLRIMLGVTSGLWAVIFIFRFPIRNLFLEPFFFILSFLLTLGVWRIYWYFFGRIK